MIFVARLPFYLVRKFSCIEFSFNTLCAWTDRSMWCPLERMGFMRQWICGISVSYSTHIDAYGGWPSVSHFWYARDVPLPLTSLLRPWSAFFLHKMSKPSDLWRSSWMQSLQMTLLYYVFEGLRDHGGRRGIGVLLGSIGLDRGVYMTSIDLGIDSECAHARRASTCFSRCNGFSKSLGNSSSYRCKFRKRGMRRA